MRKLLIHLALLLILSGGVASVAEAQCAMCKTTKEKNTAGVGKGLNTGIVYLMSVPYLAVGCLAIFWYRSSKKQKQQDNNVYPILKDNEPRP